MKDVVIGCITNYNFDQIKYWVNSLDRCGFDGHKIMICYNVGFDTCQQLADRNYSIFGFDRDEENKKLTYKKSNFSIVVERFMHIWHFMKNMEGKEDLRHIIMTDVKDVIFQTNPSEWLEKNLGDKKINVGSESITYEKEEWGRNNMLRSFGSAIYETIKNNTIVNAGTTAGVFDDYVDMCLNLSLICNGMPGYIEGGGGPDQAALNILTSLSPYKDKVNVAKSEDGWAAQLGTTKNVNYASIISEPQPVMNAEDIITTSKGIPFALVHQWDRIPEWREKIMKKYGN